MSKKKIARTKRATKPATSPPTEPMFTLAEFSKAFGENYSLIGGKGDPLTVAMCALDDCRRSLYVAAVAIGDDDEDGIGEMMTNASARAAAALNVLERFHRHGPKAEVTS